MTQFLVHPATAGCRSDPLGVCPELNGCMVGRAALPIGLSFGASAAGQIYVNAVDLDDAADSEPPVELSPGRSRGMKRATGRTILAFRRVTVCQPAPDARPDHRQPASPVASFDRTLPERGNVPDPPQASAFSRHWN